MFQKAKNISELIIYQAKKKPNETAICMAKKSLFSSYTYPAYSFSQLNTRINQYANKLTDIGVKPQDRALFFVKPNLDFAAITFALFRMGAIPVFIDPGMKKEYFLNAIEEVKPDVLLGVPKVQYYKRVRPDAFKHIRLSISTAFAPFQSAINLNNNLSSTKTDFDPYIPQDSDLAAILYTSGGTGKPKGVEYTHRIFLEQTKMLQQMFTLTADDIDIPGFPLFSFFTLALGMKSCIPDMDPSRPSEVDPKKLYQVISQQKATFLAGSPAIWDKLADYCLSAKLTLPSVRAIALFGAPISIKLHQKYSHILPNGTTYTPYGATECLPISNISGKYILNNFSQAYQTGSGICVGKPVSPVQINILTLEKDSLEITSDLKTAAVEQVGEILVQGPNMTTSYFQDPQKNAQTKLQIGSSVWHRMGDLGYLDKNGYLWFCGRKAHSLIYKSNYYFPIQVEAIFNKNPKVKKSALIKNPVNDRPAVAIEPHDPRTVLDSMFLMDLKNLAQSYEHTKGIQDFYIYNSFPVDTRHNIKIDRVELSKLVGTVE